MYDNEEHTIEKYPSWGARQSTSLICGTISSHTAVLSDTPTYHTCQLICTTGRHRCVWLQYRSRVGELNCEWGCHPTDITTFGSRLVQAHAHTRQCCQCTHKQGSPQNREVSRPKKRVFIQSNRMSTRFLNDTCFVMYTLRHSRYARLPYSCARG